MSQYLFQAEKIEDCRSGIPQIISNIHVCNSVSKILATTLGPYGLDKLFYGEKVIITNDGATILKSMKFTHPIANMLVSLSKCQDEEVGDGTTSAIILNAAILMSLVQYIREKNSLDLAKNVLKKLKNKCVEKLKTLCIGYSLENQYKLAENVLNSKSINNNKKHIAKILVEGLLESGELFVVKVPGSSVENSTVVNGVAFEKTFTYAGYEQQPKKIKNPKICCLNIELEWQAERHNAEVRVESVSEYPKVVDAEVKIITEKLDDILKSGATVVLSKLPIGDYATQYFAKHGIFSAGRVHDLEQITKAFGGKISSSTKYIKLCECELFEERQLGKKRYNYFEGGCGNYKTLILRGPGADLLEEVERAVNDAICVIKTSLKHKNVIAGGGSAEMQLSKLCRDLAFEAEPEEVIIFTNVAKAFEKIPMQLADNFGLDSVSVVQKLRKLHESNQFYGVSFDGVADMKTLDVLEPLEVKTTMIVSVFNFVEQLLAIDSTFLVKN